MESNKHLTPFFKYATLFVLLPAFLFLIVYSLKELFGGTIDINDESFSSLILFLIITGFPIFVVLLPKKTDEISKKN